MDDVTNDFYEDDEPIEKIRAAFGNGPHPVTGPSLPGGSTLIGPPATFGAGIRSFPTPMTFAVTVSSIPAAVGS